MKWRERVSILSRKRKHDQNLPVVTAASSGAGKDVENLLSQVSPVIGPDHKSYYILLRGNEDSFTCIQPSKEVITNLDEVVKNVTSCMKHSKPQGAMSSPHSRMSNVTQLKQQRYELPPHKNHSRTLAGRSRKVVRSPQDVNSKVVVTRSPIADKRSVFNSEVNLVKLGNGVENVPDRTYQTKDHMQNVTKTSTIVQTSVQDHPDSNFSNGTILPGNRITLRKDSEKWPARNSILGTVPQPGKELSENVSPFNSSIVKVESPVQVKVHTSRKSLSSLTHESRVFGEQDSLALVQKPSMPISPEPLVHPDTLCDDDNSKESLVQMSEDTSSVNGEVMSQSDDSEKDKSHIEFKIVSEDGGDLTDDLVAEQVNTIIEALEKPAQIFLKRLSAQEVFLRILPKDDDEVSIIEDDPIDIKTESNYSEENSLQENGHFESAPNGLVMPETTQPEELNLVGESTLFSFCDSIEQDNDTNGPVSVMIPPQLPELGEEELTNGYGLIGPREDEQIEQILRNELVVIQKSDGVLVNQDGTPLSDELQSILASSLSFDHPPLHDRF